ncbi:MAG TPA: hypothetical protein VF756_30920, partial [Thermoanaerobaculia bacterium]
EMERIKDHLALCTECGQLLLDLVRFEEFEPAEEPAALAGAEVEAAWQRLRPRLERGEPAAPPVAVPERFRQTEKSDPAYATVNWQRRLRSVYALAAALFFVAVGLAVWGVSQKRQVEQMAAPRLGKIAHHSLDEDQNRGGEVEEDLRFSQRDQIAISLDAPPTADYREYEAEVLDAAGRSRSEVRTPEGRVDLHFAGSFFEPGIYTIRLYGIEDGRRVPLGEIGFEILPPGARRP